MTKRATVVGASAATAMLAASMAQAAPPVGAQTEPEIVTTTVTGAQLEAESGGGSGSPASPRLVTAKNDFIAEQAAQGVFYDLQDVRASFVGGQILVWPVGTGITSATVAEVDDAGTSQLLKANVETNNSAATGGTSGTGIGYGPHEDLTAIWHCYNINGTSGAANHATWCWKKSQVLADGDGNKNYWAYKRKLTADPTTDSALDYGVTSITIGSTPTSGTESRFKAWTDMAPDGYATYPGSSASLGISVGPINMSFSSLFSDGANPSWNANDIGKYSIRWATGLVVCNGL